MRVAMVGITLLALALLNPLGAQLPKKEDIPKNIHLLKTSKVATERAYAADQLGLRGQVRSTDVKEAIEPLLEAVKSDASPTVRRAAAKAIGQITPDAEKAVPILTDALKDMAKDVRMAAAGALASFGNDARSALPALRDMAAGKDKKLSNAAKMAIRSISRKNNQ